MKKALCVLELKPYAAPELETAEVRVERGFAASGDDTHYDWDGTEKTGFDDESSYF